MADRLERIKRHRSIYRDESDFNKVFEDTADLPDTLKSIIDEEAEEPPSFENVVDKMRKFLKSQEKPEKIIWIFRKDIIFYKYDIWLRLPFNLDQTETAKKFYQIGLSAGLGININQLGATENFSLCYIWLPNDEIEMEYSMMNKNLKLCIAEPGRNIKIVKNSYLWRFFTFINKFRKLHYIESELPLKSSIPE